MKDVSMILLATAVVLVAINQMIFTKRLKELYTEVLISQQLLRRLEKRRD